jgi:hypothetical protein
MSISDKSQQQRAIAERWRKAGNPVLTRSVRVVTERADELDAEQRETLLLAVRQEGNDDHE